MKRDTMAITSGQATGTQLAVLRTVSGSPNRRAYSNLAALPFSRLEIAKERATDVPFSPDWRPPGDLPLCRDQDWRGSRGGGFSNGCQALQPNDQEAASEGMTTISLETCEMRGGGRLYPAWIESNFSNFMKALKHLPK
jgi:hypothetical protein